MVPLTLFLVSEFLRGTPTEALRCTPKLFVLVRINRVDPILASLVTRAQIIVCVVRLGWGFRVVAKVLVIRPHSRCGKERKLHGDVVPIVFGEDGVSRLYGPR